MSEGITSDLFIGVCKLLTKIHGNRAVGPELNCLVPLLHEIEQAYLSLPVIEKKSKSRKVRHERRE